jgi:hypothetical protein
VTAPEKPKKAKPKKPSFATTLPAREKAAQQCGEHVAAILRGAEPVKLAAVEAAIAADLVASGRFDPDRDTVIRVGQPIFTSPGLVTGVETPPKQQLPNPRWAGKATIARIVRTVQEAAPAKDPVETAIADTRDHLGREPTDEEAMEVEAAVAQNEAA